MYIRLFTHICSNWAPELSEACIYLPAEVASISKGTHSSVNVLEFWECAARNQTQQLILGWPRVRFGDWAKHRGGGRGSHKRRYVRSSTNSVCIAFSSIASLQPCNAGFQPTQRYVCCEDERTNSGPGETCQASIFSQIRQLCVISLQLWMQRKRWK